MTTTPKLPEGLDPVAWLYTHKISGASGASDWRWPATHSAREVHLETPLVRLSDAQAALQALKEDAARYRWLVQCKRVPWGAFLVDAHEVGIDAAIDSALALAAKEAK
jgi:hypothetical protein